MVDLRLAVLRVHTTRTQNRKTCQNEFHTEEVKIANSRSSVVSPLPVVVILSLYHSAVVESPYLNKAIS